MTRLIDKTGRIVEITMAKWNGSGYDPDWSADFFEVGGLDYEDSKDAYIVDDIDYCIDQAKDCINCAGDYTENIPDEDMQLFVEEAQG